MPASLGIPPTAWLFIFLKKALPVVRRRPGVIDDRLFTAYNNNIHGIHTVIIYVNIHYWNSLNYWLFDFSDIFATARKKDCKTY